MKIYGLLITACLLFLLSACSNDDCDELTIVSGSPSSGLAFALQMDASEELLYPVNLNEFVDEPAVDEVICAEYEETDPPGWYAGSGWCDVLNVTDCSDFLGLNFIKLTLIE